MLKKEFINKVKENSEYTNAEIENFIEVFLSTIVECVSAGEKVSFKDFGSFEAKTRAARKCKNPNTGEVIDIPEYNLPVFKAGKSFKNAVNK